MSFRSSVPVILLAATVAISLAPKLARAEGDPERGRKLAYTCYGCHGIPNYKNVYPTYSVPKLEGQHAEYLTIALQAYRSGERAHSTMHAQAISLSDQDMQDIAAFLSGKVLQPVQGKGMGELPKSGELCVTCHGPDGIGITPQYPSLAGQHEDYLERALHDYKNGARKNPIMSGFASQLSDEDIKELASYYAKQKPSLSTPKHTSSLAQGSNGASTLSAN